MLERPILKIVMLVIIVITSISLMFFIYWCHEFYNGIFRLPFEEISHSLVNTKTQCAHLGDCKLFPGDILIRRYITSRTWLFDKLAHPYFTHSSFYLGSDQLVEAVGTEKYPKDDIQTDTLSRSDWLNFDMNNFVVIRPKNYSSKLNSVTSSLKSIANDPDYLFGLPKQGQKRTTCADLIFEQLTDKNIIRVATRPQIITPDYLFWLAEKNPADFEIIGYNVSQ